jgi:dihydroxyacetone kinase-like protein
MRKLLNDPFAVVDEMVGGLLAAYPRQIEVTPSGRGIVSTFRADSRRVGIVTGGGSGHEPAFFGYVGPGLADGAALGNVFASPSAIPIVEVSRRVNRGEGVLFVYGNYEGDVMNFELASELLEDGGIRSLHLPVTDDLASAPPERRDANDRTRTIGVALGPCTVPAAGRPTFELPEGTMDVGMGVHGEAGLSRRPLASADEVADELLDLLLAELRPDGPVVALVNTLGATPLMEGLVMLRRVTERLDELGISLHRAYAGEFVTSLEMAGLSLTIAALDDELRRLLEAPARALAAPPLAEPW